MEILINTDYHLERWNLKELAQEVALREIRTDKARRKKILINWEKEIRYLKRKKRYVCIESLESIRK